MPKMDTRRRRRGSTGPLRGSKPACAASTAGCGRTARIEADTQKLIARAGAVRQRARQGRGPRQAARRQRRRSGAPAGRWPWKPCAKCWPRRKARCPRSMSRSTAASTAWPARRGRRRTCSGWPSASTRISRPSRATFGEIGDNRLTVMAGIAVLDELAEAERRIALLKQDVANLTAGRRGADRRKPRNSSASSPSGSTRRPARSKPSPRRSTRPDGEHHQSVLTRRPVFGNLCQNLV